MPAEVCEHFLNWDHPVLNGVSADARQDAGLSPSGHSMDSSNAFLPGSTTRSYAGTSHSPEIPTQA
jgi:hypothetical protein